RYGPLVHLAGAGHAAPARESGAVRWCRVIDELLRETFARHEDLVPSAADLRPVIAAGTRRRRIFRRRLAWSASLFAVLLMAPLLLLLPSAPPRSESLSLSTPPRPLRFLLLGIDRKPGAAGEPARADAILLLQVDPATGTAYQVSVPRDL